MANVVMLSIIMLSVIVPNDDILSIIMLNVIMLTVMSPSTAVDYGRKSFITSMPVSTQSSPPPPFLSSYRDKNVAE
jgi:hypothetical protein